MVKLPHKTLETKIIAQGYGAIIGIDEVGMGCLAGPVTACAVMIEKKFYTQSHRGFFNLRDSKLLSAKQRETYYNELVENSFMKHAVVSIDVQTIDTINIYQASRKAMLECLDQLKTRASSEHSFLLVDGNKLLKGTEINQRAIVKGDRKIFAIACASIIAKVTRDRLMLEYAKEFPGYGFEKHKGYGTALHKAGLKALGPCVLHRRLFHLD